MKRVRVIILIFLFLSANSIWAESPNPLVRMVTNHGVITLELHPQEAPQTVKNFIQYVQDGFYNGTIFHRVIKGFMIQGGGLTADMQKKKTLAPIPNEADSGLKNRRGTIAMARTMNPHSATSQFFINTVDNPFLDHKGKNPKGWGYCVFGKVVDGMDVVDAIERLSTTFKTGRRDVPITPVIIKRACLEKKTHPAKVKK
ncbi:MAG: peptidyl-prolyl cis-trans isomerase [Desulfobacteraceae bacterium]|nr:peptidyl-prolyl cis-trans isomerase [Desulfobacteraceae bacterium]